MAGVDSITSNLYFQAASMTAASQASKAKKEEETQKTKRSSFSSAMEKAQVLHQLEQEGFPPELADKSIEEAVIFLKDEADMAADRLKETQTQEQFVDYRKKVSRFLRYLERNNFEIEYIKRPKIKKNGQFVERDPYKQVVIINQKLEQIAEWLLSSHRDALTLLAKVDEIQGLMVDLMAS